MANVLNCTDLCRLQDAPTGIVMMISCLKLKMTMTMTMRTAISGKALVIKYHFASKEVELVTGKYFLCFAESAVAHHLCEP